ncbi:hypothetical protein BU15DRAFT_65339 [Melanogaster broomeanus]|nr:hypothetical protein BU15DRAFT_65339 [Melanogaster broomeanus]
MVQTRSTTNKIQTRGAQKATASTGTSATKYKASTSPHDGDSDVQVQVPAKKRLKDSKGKRRRAAQSSQKLQRGRLEMLPELNLDVLFQVLMSLLRRDVFLTSLIDSQFSASYGPAESCTHNQSVPPALDAKVLGVTLKAYLTVHLIWSEPQYAYLAFDPHCHHCGSVVRTIHWRLRRRYCPSCRKARLRSCGLIGDSVQSDGLVPEEFLKGVARPAYASYLDLEKLDAFYKQYNEIPQDLRDEFLAIRRRQVCAINEHASECEEWHEDMLQARKDELGAAKHARAESIFTRLKNLGYTSELDYFGTDPFEDDHRSIFNSTKPLTDQEWVLIRRQLERTMNEYRILRLETAVYNPRRRLLIELYNAYVRQPAPPGATVDLLPDVVDLADFAAFDAIIKLPEGTEVNAETFKPAFEQIPTLVQEWRADVDAQLAALVVIPGDSSTSGVAEENDFSDGTLKPAERLNLASAVFEDRSDNLMVSIDFLDQPLFNRCYSDSVASRVIHGRPWSVMDERGKYPLVQFFTGAACVVRACGMDPRTATVEDMDERDIRLGCKYCSNNSMKMTWRTAMLHVQSHRNDCKWNDDPNREETMWFLNDSSYMPKTQDVARAPIKHSGYSSPNYRCALCQSRVGNSSGSLNVCAHLRTRHGIEVYQKNSCTS